MEERIQRIHVIVDDLSLDWLTDNTTRLTNRSMLIRRLIHEQVARESTARRIQRTHFKDANAS